MDEFLLPEGTNTEQGPIETEFRLATVAEYSATNGARLLFPGETEAQSKFYKCLDSAAALSAGARVVAMKQSGTYIVLGTVSGDSTTFSTSNLSEIATAASGFTLVAGRYAQAGKVAQLYLQFRPTTAITSAQEFQVATLIQGKRPPFNAAVNYWTNNGGEILSNGRVLVYGTCTNTSANYTLFSTYLLA